MKFAAKLLKSLLITAALLFAGTFTIYYLNLENKLIYKVIYPLLQKHYNSQQRDRRPSLSHDAPPPSAVGQRTVNTAPPSGRLAAETVPPRFITVSCTMDNPKPVPPAARDRALSTR